MNTIRTWLIILAAGTLCAQKISIDNRFLPEPNTDKTVRGWDTNKYKDFLPLGSATPVMADGKAGVRIRPQGTDTSLFIRQLIPAKGNERFRLSCLVKGKGKFSLGLYYYNEPQDAWGGSLQSPKNIDTDTPQPITVDVTLPDQKVMSIRPTLQVSGKGADVHFYGLQLERLTPIPQP